MATLNTELSLVRRFHALLQNYDARPAVARRNTLPTLSRFLCSKDRQIRKLSLEAVLLLAEHPENLELLGRDRDLLSGVVGIYEAAQYDDPEMCEIANRTLDWLAPTFEDGDPREQVVARRAVRDSAAMSTTGNSTVANHYSSELWPSGAAAVAGGELTEVSNAVGDYDTIVGVQSGELPKDSDQVSIISNDTGVELASSSSGQTRRVGELQRPSEVVRGAGRDSTLSIVLEIPALDETTDLTDIEEILQTTRGVISYTITASAHQVRVFLSAFSQATLQQVLADAGYETMLRSAERLRYGAGDAGNQSLNNSFFFDQASRRPSYVQTAKTFAASLYRSVMVYRDPQNNALAARVRQQRAAQEDKGSKTADKLAQAFSRWW